MLHKVKRAKQEPASFVCSPQTKVIIKHHKRIASSNASEEMVSREIKRSNKARDKTLSSITDFLFGG